MSGYELRQLIEGSIGNFWSESYGQIYPALKRLEQDGLVSVAEGERAGSKIYTLTEAGDQRLRRWLGVAPRAQVPRNELLLKLFFGALQPVATSQQHVAERRRGLLADLKRYEAIERELERKHAENVGLPFWLMTVRYGKAEAQALLAWCDETLATLDALRDERSSAADQVSHEPEQTLEEIV